MDARLTCGKIRCNNLNRLYWPFFAIHPCPVTTGAVTAKAYSAASLNGSCMRLISLLSFHPERSMAICYEVAICEATGARSLLNMELMGEICQATAATPVRGKTAVLLF
jgi:hypothetical protein